MTGSGRGVYVFWASNKTKKRKLTQNRAWDAPPAEIGGVPLCNVGVIQMWGRDPAQIFKVGNNLMFQLCNPRPLNIYAVGINTKKINNRSNEKDRARMKAKSKREQNNQAGFSFSFYSQLSFCQCVISPSIPLTIPAALIPKADLLPKSASLQ